MPKYYPIKKTNNPKKAAAWKWFSKYIRLRDALETTGTTEYCKCITCGEVKPIEQIDAGHAIPGRTDSILFLELLCHGQCQSCNRFHSGEYQAYKRLLIEKHGQNMWDMWEQMKKKPFNYSNFEFEQIARTYRHKVKELMK